MRHIAIKLFTFSLIITNSNRTFPAESSDLLFMYSDHEPYIISTNTGLSGFLADYINQVSDVAKIVPHWSNVAWKKQLPTLKRNTPNICAVTLYKTPERQAYIRFTAPIGVNSGFVLVGIKNNKQLKQHRTFKEVVADPVLRPVLQANTIYNNYIDTLIHGKDYTHIEGSFERIARSHIKTNRDYFIIAGIRARTFMKKPDLRQKLAIYATYPDLIEETPYYIGCSLATDDQVFRRLNEAIKQRGIVAPQ